MSDFGEGKTLKTRVAHRCEWCGQQIEAKVDCFHYKGMFQDEWQDWYMHLECNEDYSINSRDYEDGFSPYEQERPTVKP
jgi:hypothetical protein